MGNLKVGDKVRSLVTQIDVRAGELYEVKTVDDGDVLVIDDVGDNWYLASDEFEIVPVAAAQTFKVGDRVRTEGWSRFYEVVGVEVGHIWVKLYDGSSSKESTEGKTFEFELAPLKIEAGKYYRTRDGRKVGPMEAWCFGGWHSDRAEHPLNGGVWLEDGTAKYAGAKDSPALIAEWIDEPVKASPKTDLKRGHKVKITVDRPEYELRQGDVGTLLEDDTDTAPYIQWERTHKTWAISNEDLELVINDSEPLKAAAPVAVQQDAPDLTLKVSFDTADITNAIKTTLLKTKQGYGFEIARHGDYVWVDTGQKAPIVLKSTDVQAAVQPANPTDKPNNPLQSRRGMRRYYAQIS